ncbi:M48 family metalloprotease [Sphingobium sp. SCG-1]|uniref:M48 family metalloprotease n=1 Tax=Sphingobium sp. SCG-1 TaxID=2072936 RepID=UPI00167026ED|nr:M48 family metalloprotease [Sphingobium sp. SCG-1]
MTRCHSLLLLALLTASCGRGPPPPPDYQAQISQHDRAIGAEQHPALLEAFGGVYAGRQSAYVTAVGERMANAAKLKGQCHFTLVNSDVVNAFAVPGCYIYITRGLLAVVNSEAELASVLGHELGHIVAQHSDRQEQRSLWRTLGVIAVSLTGSEKLTDLAGQAAQFFGLRYSRKQEYESDDLGVRYLQSAGYDPYAATDMLQALQAQEAQRSEAGGQDAKALPEWTLSHPLTEKRIARAHASAEATGLADDTLPENQAALLKAVDGMLYGDDPEQGFVLGQRFAHPVLRIGFAAPSGFTMTNSPAAIRLMGPEGIQGEFGGGALKGRGIAEYANALLTSVLGKTQATIGRADEGSVNGLPAFILPVHIMTQNGPAQLHVAVYDGGNGQAYHFIIAAPPGIDSGPVAAALFSSFHRLSDAEIGKLRARRIEVVRVASGDTTVSLGKQMAGDGGEPLLRALNGIVDSSVRSGQFVKLVTWAS